MAERTVNSRQLAVLKWIVDGCPEGVMTEVNYKTSAVALATRRLVSISHRRGVWKAEPTMAGRFFAEHQQYPPGHWRSDDRAVVLPMGPSHKIEHKVTGLRPVDQMIADVIKAGGVMPIDANNDSYWENLVASANRYNKVPAGKTLKIERGKTWSERVLRLEDAPQWMSLESAPIVVADQLRNPHFVIKNLRDDHDRLQIAHETRMRALRILDAIAKAAISRGYQVTTPKKQPGYYYPKGYMEIAISGHSHVLDICELSDKVPHEPTAKELKDKERYSWTHVPEFDLVSSGRLRIRVLDGWKVRKDSFTDMKTSPLEEQLSDVLLEIECRAAAEEERDRRLELERLERRHQWELILEEAKSSARMQHRADVLMRQVEHWREAISLEAYIQAATAKMSTDTGEEKAAAQEWLDWARQYLEDLDPLRHDLETPPDPEFTPEILKPFMHGLSVFGPN